MCLILFSFDPASDTPLLLAANRDEFFARPTASARAWQDHPTVFAGRDLIAQGTWLGMTTTGRFAAITNIREPNVVVDRPLSRGDLTREFLISDMPAEAYLQRIEKRGHRYCGFNLLVGELRSSTTELWYLSNRHKGCHCLSAGLYGLSNHLLDSPWPKVTAGKQFLQEQQQHTPFKAMSEEDKHRQLRQYLENASVADDERLPSTGVSYEKEKALSAAFIQLPDYGTRTSTVVSVQSSKQGNKAVNQISFSEKSYYLPLSQLESESSDYIYQEWYC